MLCAFLAVAVLTGCSAGEGSSSGQPSFSIIDAGEYTSAVKPQTVASYDEPQSEPVSAPQESGEEQPTESVSAESEPTISEPQESNSSESTPTESVSSESEPPESEPVVTPATTATTAEPVTVTTTTEQEQPVQQPEELLVQPEFGTNSYSALNHAEVQGVWISYLEFMELLQGKNESQFRGNIAEAFDNCVELGLNTVYIHARSHSDAFYESELFPWSKYVTGTLGADPGFDPLEIVIEEAHARSISVQAWINPLRAVSTSDMDSYGDYAVYKWHNDPEKKGKYVVPVSGYYYLNPAYDEVIQLIADGAAEIVARYDVDGLHIDDYFYPTTDASFDSAAFGESGYSVLSDFRFANCDRLVSSIYSAVKSANPTALFSVSCQGSIENNYNLMYADVEKWCTQSGYLDYIVPQIYYGFDNSTQPYVQCLSRWEDFAARGGIPLVTGLSVSKVGYEDKWAGEGKTEWLTDKKILARQLEEAMKCTSYGGAALYSYKSIFSAENSVSAQVNEEMTAYSLMIKQ